MAEAAADPCAAFPRPLAGKIVAIVHPAWHSCGSHGVFAAQAQAYGFLGAQTIGIALADTPGCTGGSKCAAAYLAATSDLDAGIRVFAGMPLKEALTSRFLRAGIAWLHGNQAIVRLEVARHTAVPELRPRVPRIDLIHCNHFFTMPAAVRLRDGYGCPIILETHDLQARQYALHAPFGVRLPPGATFEAMLAIECAVIGQADMLVHLNAEEAQEFQQLLPGLRHALIYPAAGPMPAGAGGGEAIIVAAANYPNFLGLRWFLQEVLPRAPQARVRIYGGIAKLLRWRAPLLYKKYAPLFAGRVDGSVLCNAYRNASAVLLPATAGHGISIKAIEALSSGAPLIATKLAFRGFPPGATDLANVTIAEDAACFAAALARAHDRRPLPDTGRASSPARRFYERHFAFDAYCRSLLAAAGTVMEGRPHEQPPLTPPRIKCCPGLPSS